MVSFSIIIITDVRWSLLLSSDANHPDSFRMLLLLLLSSATSTAAGQQQMTLSLLLFVDDPLGRLKDLVVDGHHHSQRDVKGTERGVDLVPEFLTHLFKKVTKLK